MSGVTLNPPTPAKTELVPRWRASLGEYVTAAQISSDARSALVGLGDGTVIGLDLETGREVLRFAAHAGGLFALSIAPRSDAFVTCGPEPHAKLWNVSGNCLAELGGGGSAWVEHVAWSPSGDRVATAAGRKVRLWTAAGEPLLETEPLASTVSSLAWRADGTAVAACCYGGVHIWPLLAHARCRHLEWKGSLISLAWSPNGKVLACGSQDCSVHFWRLASGQDSEMRGYPFKPSALAWDHESRLLATAGDKVVTVWDFRGKGPEGKAPIQLDAHQGQCVRLAFGPCSSVLASGSQDTSVLLWQPRRGNRPTRFAFLKDSVTALAWHPKQLGLLGADASGNVCFWAT